MTTTRVLRDERRHTRTHKISRRRRREPGGGQWSSGDGRVFFYTEEETYEEEEVNWTLDMIDAWNTDIKNIGVD